MRDIGLAEDLVQDALVIALGRWPGTGIPRNPAVCHARARTPEDTHWAAARHSMTRWPGSRPPRTWS
jgi:predicted RNA polymerase sigma factor